MDKQQTGRQKLRYERKLRGWSQADLAERIGSDTKTVGRWEQGKAFPGPYFLQKLAELFGKSPKELGLLSEQEVEQIDMDKPIHFSSWREDLGDAPDIEGFCGRGKELADAEQWIGSDHCRIVAVLGIGGVGKTMFVTKLASALRASFEYVFWRSLQHAPSVESFLESYLQFVFHSRRTNLPKDLDGQLSLMLTSLREQRCLLILDNFESVLSARKSAGQYGQGYEGYGRLLRLIGESDHASCLLLTSREKPREVARMEGKASAVRTLQLGGITSTDGQQLLKDRELFGPDAAWATFVHLYSGNPLALKLVAEPIREVFGGDIAKFTDEGETMFGDLEMFLEEQFIRLGELERAVMCWLAIEREALSLHELGTKILPAEPKKAVLEAVDSLRRRSLVETRDDGRLTLQPVIMEYVTGRFVERIFEELVAGKIEVFDSHALMQAEAKDYVRRNQERFILTAVAEKLITTFGKTGGEEKLRHILSILHTTHAGKPGYAAGNILNLLLKLQADLRGVDFSSLAVGQAYLQGADLADVNFAHADLMTSVFTDTFSSILCVALTANGKLLAAGTTTGELRLWLAESLTPLFICIGHADGIRSVAFSPDGRLLASGSEDFTVRLWDTDTGSCVRVLHGHTGLVRSVAFSPDGWTIASGSEDETIRTWDATAGRCLSTLGGHRGWVRSVAFSIDGNILAGGGDDGTVRLWETSTGQSLNILRAHNKAVRAVTFSPIGGILASGSEDTTIRMWDFSTGDCFLILHGHTDFVRAMAFSPDGTLLASSSDDQTISLWDSKTGSSLKVLRPQSNRIWSLAFFPDSKTLVSASESAAEDETLQYWETLSGQCIRKLRGYSNLIKSVAFSPNGQVLVSGSEDHALRLWEVKSGRCLKTMRGHINRLRSVAFSPDGTMVASGSEDETVRVWDVKSGQCLKILRGHTHLVRSVTFNVDGSLIASASHDRTIRVWDAKTGQCLKTLQEHNSVVWSVAFSPDEHLIASGQDDALVCLWDTATGTCLKTLQGHKHRVWSVAFSPDGRTIASSNDDGTIKLWNVDTGACIKTLRNDRPYERMNIIHARGLTEAQKISLKVLGAIEDIE